MHSAYAFRAVYIPFLLPLLSWIWWYALLLYDDINSYIDKLGGIAPNERIFMFTKSSLGREFKRITALAGLEPIRVHDLRHSHASMLINMGEELLEISHRFGHESEKLLPIHTGTCTRTKISN